MNLVIITNARTTKDADVRYSQGANGNMAIARFTLAVDKNYKKDSDDKANFINCVCFGKLAEIVEKHCSKGTKLNVMGEWVTGSYKDKNGNTVYTNDCNVSKLEFCESKSNNQSSAPKNSGDEFMSIPDDAGESLPF